MYNDFIIVGPSSDPAKISGLKDAAQAFKQIAETKSTFAFGPMSREGRTQAMERCCTDPKQASGTWYLETGSSMGATLNTAVGKNASLIAARG
jgi:tungstate transport system substrate-binding protein